MAVTLGLGFILVVLGLVVDTIGVIVKRVDVVGVGCGVAIIGLLV